MTKTDYRFLKFASFFRATNWSAVVPVIMASAFDESCNAKLSSVIKRVKDTVTIENDKQYTRITIRQYGQGVIARDMVLGNTIGTKRQFLATGGQLIVSGIDARNGSIGIVPEELTGAIVTNDFWLFDIADTVVPQYLFMLLSAERFQQYWQSKSSGTTNRQRINQNDLLAMEIPLPDLATQHRIVDKYNVTNTEAKHNEKLAKQFEDSIDNVLFQELGIEEVTNKMKSKSNYTFLKLSKLSKINRWDVWNRNERFISTKYDFQAFETVVNDKPLYGANEKAVRNTSGVRYIRITDINEDGSLNDDIVSAQTIEDKYLLKENDFLIARSGNTVGKTFLYKDSMGKAIFAGYLVKYVLNGEKVFPEYILHYTKSRIFKDWIANNQRIFGQPNINGQEYLKASIIVPPIEIQKTIANKILAIREQVKAHRQKATSLRALAKKQFEEDIFGE